MTELTDLCKPQSKPAANLKNLCKELNEELESRRRESIHVRRYRMAQLLMHDHNMYNSELGLVNQYKVIDLEEIDLLHFIRQQEKVKKKLKKMKKVA